METVPAKYKYNQYTLIGFYRFRLIGIYKIILQNYQTVLFTKHTNNKTGITSYKFKFF